MNIKFELYEELDLLIDQDEIAFLPKGIKGNIYLVEEATTEDLEELNGLPLKNISSVADVKEMLNEIWFTLGQKCNNEDFLDVEDYNIIYNHQEKRFISVSDLEVEPVYMYYDGNDWISVWLPEPDHIVEVEEDEDEEPFSLDRWDGNNLTYGGVGCHAEYYPICRLNGEPVENKGLYLLRRWSQWEGDQPSGEIISSKELEEIKAKAGE